MSDFSQLEAQLQQMKTQAAQLDRMRGEHRLPLFDERLFRCLSRLMTPCVDETLSTLKTLMREKDSGLLTGPRAEFLTEKLLAQTAALQRELATSELRKKEPKHSHYYRKPINELYQEMAQHQEWERRLVQLLDEKQRALQTASLSMQASAQQAVLQTEQRLKRCQESKLRIEKQITYRERNQ